MISCELIGSNAEWRLHKINAFSSLRNDKWCLPLWIEETKFWRENCFAKFEMFAPEKKKNFWDEMELLDRRMCVDEIIIKPEQRIHVRVKTPRRSFDSIKSLCLKQDWNEWDLIRKIFFSLCPIQTVGFVNSIMQTIQCFGINLSLIYIMMMSWSGFCHSPVRKIFAPWIIHGDVI